MDPGVSVRATKVVEASASIAVAISLTVALLLTPEFANTISAPVGTGEIAESCDIFLLAMPYSFYIIHFLIQRYVVLH